MRGETVGKWIGSRIKVLVRATLTLYAASAFALVIHESAHSLVALIGGAELRGYVVGLLMRGGETRLRPAIIMKVARLPNLTTGIPAGREPS